MTLPRGPYPSSLPPVGNSHPSRRGSAVLSGRGGSVCTVRACVLGRTSPRCCPSAVLSVCLAGGDRPQGPGAGLWVCLHVCASLHTLPPSLTQADPGPEAGKPPPHGGRRRSSRLDQGRGGLWRQLLPQGPAAGAHSTCSPPTPRLTHRRRKEGATSPSPG